ncbi:20862_t:CDS:2, partial [Rhizophagus irregularis]
NFRENETYDQHEAHDRGKYQNKWKKLLKKLLNNVRHGLVENVNECVEKVNHQEPRYYWTEDFCKEIDKLVLKKLSSENYMDLRDIPEELQGLTEIENLQYDSLDILHTSLNILIVRLPQQLEETTDEVFDNDNKEAENIDTIF